MSHILQNQKLSPDKIFSDKNLKIKRRSKSKLSERENESQWSEQDKFIDEMYMRQEQVTGNDELTNKPNTIDMLMENSMN